MKPTLHILIALLLAPLAALHAAEPGLKNQTNLETRFINFNKDDDGKLTREEFVRPSAS